ncbi:MAG: hypothetical protein JXQ73_28045 [Phycisphaerae bacterium]|nr:hypothetical protein [Phycisphaerae bacterium]
MRAALSQADAFLRATGPFAPSEVARRPRWWLPVIVVTFAPIYGATMGSYHLVAVERAWQMVFSGVKIPMLLLATSALCLPGFFVLNTILGLREDLREALQAIVAGQAGLSVALASLSPVIRFWYFSCDTYQLAVLANAAMFALATIAGHLVMLRYYRVLIRRHPCHRIALYGWLGLYAFVGVQMGWMLRPFVGAPIIRVSFFRDEPFSNAYVVVAGLLFG